MNDPINITSFVRMKMKRYISHKYTQGGNTLVNYLLDPEIETLLANHQMIATAAYLAQLKPRDRGRVLTAVEAAIGRLPATAQPPVVLTNSSVSSIFPGLIALKLHRVAVMCYRELSPDMNIQPDTFKH